MARTPDDNETEALALCDQDKFHLMLFAVPLQKIAKDLHLRPFSMSEMPVLHGATRFAEGKPVDTLSVGSTRYWHVKIEDVRCKRGNRSMTQADLLRMWVPGGVEKPSASNKSYSVRVKDVKVVRHPSPLFSSVIVMFVHVLDLCSWDVLQRYLFL